MVNLMARSLSRMMIASKIIATMVFPDATISPKAARAEASKSARSLHKITAPLRKPTQGRVSIPAQRAYHFVETNFRGFELCQINRSQ
jgi:hypothetical protein